MLFRSYDGVLGLVENERPELNTEAKQIQYVDNVYGETSTKSLYCVLRKIKGLSQINKKPR